MRGCRMQGSGERTALSLRPHCTPSRTTLATPLYLSGLLSLITTVRTEAYSHRFMMKISEENVCTGSSYTAEALNVKSGVIVIGVSTINVFTKEHEEKIEVPLTAGTSWEGT